MNRRLSIAYALGAALIVLTLVGANQFPGSKADAPGGGGNPPAKPGEGLIAKGTVTTEFDTIPIFLPAHLPSGRIAEVKVRDGQTVKKGDELVRFDDWKQQSDVRLAEAAKEAAIHDYSQATEQHKSAVEQHKIQVLKAELAVKNATDLLSKAKDTLAAIRKQLELQLKNLNNLNQVETQVQENLEYIRAGSMLKMAENQLQEKQYELDQVRLQVIPHVEAKAWVATQAKTAHEAAVQAAERCVLRADLPGVIENVSASPGQVIYPQGRQPICYLVPDGTRYIKAEVVPQFGSKIQGKENTKVVITDDTNHDLKYEGVVDRLGTAFLPKANGLDVYTGKSTTVLLVTVRVTDPAPAGRPPLRVGQPVRVIFP